MGVKIWNELIKYNGLSKMKDTKDSVSLETLAVNSVCKIWFSTLFIILTLSYLFLAGIYKHIIFDIFKFIFH